ncbi:UPF0686 protein C11orf1 homolog [Mobula hypostoma]|uniref:UPF0686 protein C11orf1 homolog n=1 Tax=Mobula hypostoma TaxID=723540 RepID=UPI002FC3A795
MEPFTAAAAGRQSLVQGAAMCPVPPGEPDVGGNRYGPRTLVTNWFEERSGLGEIRKMKPLPTQYEYVYRTIYMDTYGKADTRHKVFKDEPHVYPGHQPELNPPHTKAAPKTSYMLDYEDPGLQTDPAHRRLGHRGPPVPPGAGAGAGWNPLCSSSAAGAAAAVEPRFCGSYVPPEGHSGQWPADFCRPCAVPPGAGVAGWCGAAIP